MLHFKLTKTRLMPACMIAGILSLMCAQFAGAGAAKAILVQAIMCETIENYQPVNPAVVFSMSQGEVFCYSRFDPVLEKTVIFHKWYKRDKLVFKMPLTLQPPKWSSFTRVQIRDQDKGPWRVEIWDEGGALLQTLRFGMAD